MSDFLDFNNIFNDSSSNKLDDPRDIFDLKGNKNKKYGDILRIGQDIVLKKWYEKYKGNKNTIIKMNTGNGKTVVGLLILQSYLNSGDGPAVYVSPDNFLVEQVIHEANDLKLSVTTDPTSSEFIEGESILVINMHKLFNGRSVFGVNKQNINIGCIIIDDAHACLNIAKKQFEIYIPKKNENLYNFFLNTFSNSIKQQSEIRLDEIKNGEPGAQQLIPYWAWEKELGNVQEELIKYKDNNSEENKSLYFNWPLIKENINVADCIISSNGVSLSLEYLPTDVIPSFYRSNHKIFMSATIEDDTLLSTQFGIDISKLNKVITPDKANDIGERMILIPQRLNNKLNDSDLKKLFVEFSNNYNIVVLVPSLKRAQSWKDCADIIIKSHSQMVDVINQMKKELVGIVVITNRYDGIDLPNNACNILVIDGLPDTRSGYDKFEESALMNTDSMISEKIQKVEQGMGRVTRSREDHGVVFLMGNSLVNILTPSNKKNFTISTQKQLKFSEQIVKQLKQKDDNPLNLLYRTSLLCLLRDNDWIEHHNEQLLGLKYDDHLNIDYNKIELKKAFDLYRNRNYEKCLEKIQSLVNKEQDPTKKGYLKFKYAKYENILNKAKSQEILKSARNLNHNIIYPIAGINYEKINPNNTQTERILEFNSKFENTNDYIIYVKDVLDSIDFETISAYNFEEAMKKLGSIIGFCSQRPENEFGKGPDNLWIGSENNSFIIECKNESETEYISKDYCNQLNGSKEWFSNEYKEALSGIPVLVHPSRIFEYSANPSNQIRIINKDKLSLLKESVLSFSRGISSDICNTGNINTQLKFNGLEFSQIKDKFTTSYKNQK